MLTRSVTPTPFGFRLSYALDGESYWTEYVMLPRHERPSLSLLQRLSMWTGQWVHQLAGAKK